MKLKGELLNGYYYLSGGKNLKHCSEHLVAPIDLLRKIASLAISHKSLFTRIGVQVVDGLAYSIWHMTKVLALYIFGSNPMDPYA